MLFSLPRGSSRPLAPLELRTGSLLLPPTGRKHRLLIPRHVHTFQKSAGSADTHLGLKAILLGFSRGNRSWLVVVIAVKLLSVSHKTRHDDDDCGCGGSGADAGTWIRVFLA